MDMNTSRYIKTFRLSLMLGLIPLLGTSCEDYFDQETNHVITSNDNHLHVPTDTVYTTIGILEKMQAIADRVVLLGEARADLVDITSSTSTDLRNLALFNLSDSSSIYNQPRDYYAIINNCNYLIAQADTALTNSEGSKVFMREFVAAKTFRAWTYLQLVLAYGRVPYVTSPILSSADLQRDYPQLEIKELCNNLISDIEPLAGEILPLFPGLPIDNRLAFIPTKLILGDLCLWAERYGEAAKWYYSYITTRNGEQTIYPLTTNSASWGRDDHSYQSWIDGFSTLVISESYGSDGEAISLIACPTDRSQAHYSMLRDIFNSTSDNKYSAQLKPSVALTALSEKQAYCNYNTAGEVEIIDKDEAKQKGDLRLPSVYNEYSVNYNNAYQDAQFIAKHSSTNVHLYRRSMVYLRFAEALNRAGYPRYAFEILSEGVNDSILRECVLPYVRTAADSQFVSSLSFPENKYIVRRLAPKASGINTMGIHSRGSGWTEFNTSYTFPVSPEGVADTLAYQIEQVENMIMDEGALELAFEGYRFYDLMRVALRRNDPGYLANKIYARKGENEKGTMQALLGGKLNNYHSWFLSWKGQIGF